MFVEAIDTVDRLAENLVGSRFTEVTLPERTEVLREFKANDPLDAFAMVRDLTYEAYYAHPHALDVLERETGWRYEAALSGGQLEPFDDRLLARTRTVPPHWRNP